MTRKVSYRYGNRNYAVDGNDIDKIIDTSGLEGFLEGAQQREAFLGLLYIRSLSWQGGGAGTIPLFNRIDGARDTVARKLLRPAFDVIKNYSAS